MNPKSTPDDKQQKPENQALEDQFFDENNALKYGAEVSEAVADTMSPTGLEDKLRRLKVKGISESPHLSKLAGVLEFLERAGIGIVLGGKTVLMRGRKTTIYREATDLVNYLKYGSISTAFLLPLTASSPAVAQGVGSDLMQKGAQIMQPGIDGNTIYHYDAIIISILLLLGLGTGAYAIVKQLKKPAHKQKVAKAKKQFKAYEEAKRTGTVEQQKEAKQALMGNLMGELPKDMNEAVETPNIEPDSEKNVVEALKYKKEVDDLIAEVVGSIEAKMILPVNPDISAVDAKKRDVLGEFEGNIKKIEDKIKKIDEESAVLNAGDYKLNQLNFEKKKLEHILAYLKAMQKLFLILIQELKNNLLAKNADAQVALTEEDVKLKKLALLKNKLHELLEGQAAGDPTAFEAELKALDKKIDEQKAELGDKKEVKEEVKAHELTLYYEGFFNHDTGVCYNLDGAEHAFALNENFEVQIWVNPDGSIGFNLTHNNAIAIKGNLIIKNNDLFVEGEDKSLKDVVSAKQSELATQQPQQHPVEAPETAPVIKQLAQKVLEVGHSIKEKQYQLFGAGIDIDDETIEKHLVRVHREFHGGKPKTAVRFTLSEHAWKAAVASLQHQNDVPKNTVSFSFEDEHGNTMQVGQEMIEFNVIHNGKSATVMIPKDTKLLAMRGEVRVIFDPKVDYRADEVETILQQAANRLTIGDKMKPVTPEAREKLQKKLIDIRRGKPAVADAKGEVSNEYKAELAQPASAAELVKKGLHSVYLQFDIGNLSDIFKSGHSLSTTTRWSKGIFTQGMSSSEDMVKGGATEVFTRIHTKDSAKNGTWYATGKPSLVFPPKVLERLDLYCYASDNYGSKMPSVFDQRISPEQLVDMMKSNYASNNEVMFFDALKVEDASYVVCDNDTDVAKTIATLKHIGTTQIGGKPLNKAVITRQQFSQIYQV